MALNILDKEKILGSSEVINGYALIGSYAEQPTKNNSTYFNGVLYAKGEIPFKVWQGTTFDEMKRDSYEGKICQIYGKKNVWQGQTSIIIEAIESALSPEECEQYGIKKSDFMIYKYDIERFSASFKDTVKRNVSDKAYEVFEAVLASVPEERFNEEFAAIHHHDCCVGGLLAHSWKVTKLCTMLKIYPEIVKKISPDLLFLGASLHDIGKVVEYNNGSITDIGRVVDHNTMGVVMLIPHRELIIDRMGEDFFNQLLSIVSQHHGEFGSRPRTVASYVIHTIDMLDSKLTSLNEVLEASDGGQIAYDGYKLN